MGRGQSKQLIDAKDCAQQIRAGEEFANIFMNDPAGVLLEVKQGMEPATYLPKKDACHRAPKKKVEQTKVSKVRGGKSKTVGFRRGEKQVEVTEGMFREKCLLAMEVMDDKITPDMKMNKINNPPLIVMATPFIHKCKGCKGRITPEDKAYPHDMVLRHMGVRGYYNTILNHFVKEDVLIHFYLNMKCLRKNDAMVKTRYISGNDEAFITLDKKRMEYLHSLGLLKPFARKKCLY